MHHGGAFASLINLPLIESGTLTVASRTGTTPTSGDGETLPLDWSGGH